VSLSVPQVSSLKLSQLCLPDPTDWPTFNNASASRRAATIWSGFRRFRLLIENLLADVYCPDITALHKSLDLLTQPLLFGLLVLEPVSRPDSVNLPASTSYNLLSKPVSLTGGAGGVVRFPIAFDSEEELVVSLRLEDTEIDEVPGHPYLWREYGPVPP
jgi:hypothetical protein